MHQYKSPTVFAVRALTTAPLNPGNELPDQQSLTHWFGLVHITMPHLLRVLGPCVYVCNIRRLHMYEYQPPPVCGSYFYYSYDDGNYGNYKKARYELPEQKSVTHWVGPVFNRHANIYFLP